MSVKKSETISVWADQNKYGASEMYFEDGLAQIESRTCGLYLLEFENSQAYVGISIDIKSRLKQHAVNHSDIAKFRVRPLDATSIELRRIERSLVHSAETAGITLRNREHAAVIVGVSTLDAVVSPKEQSKWLKNPSAVNRGDASLGVDYSESQLAAHANSYAKLEAHPRYADIIRALGAYLDACVPYPSRTEGTFWTVSCFPGSSRSLILRVSMGMLEMFYIWVNPKSGQLEVRLFVDGTHLPTPRRLSLHMPWRKLSKHVQAGPRGHKSAGAFERTVLVRDVGDLEEALRIPGVARAAASHALAVMRKRQSGYKPSHCPQLASAGTAVPSSGRADVSPAAETVGRELRTPESSDVLPTSFPESPVESAVEGDKVRAFVRADPDGEVTRRLAGLIEVALPDPRSDVAQHWGLSCMPGTNAGRGRKRLFTLNVGRIEVAVAIASVRSEDSARSGFVVVSASELEALTGASLEELAKKYMRLRFHQHGYVAAQGDDVNIGWDVEPDSLAQLDELPWKESCAVLVDSLRSSLCPYAKFHNETFLAQLSA